MDERVLQRETIEKGMKKGVREGIKKGMKKGKIKDVVKLIVDIDEAMKDLELAAEYKYKVLAQLKNNTTD